MISFKGRHFPKDLILMAVKRKVACPLSSCQIEELVAERAVKLDHSIVQKWVVHYAPQLEAEFRQKKRSVDSSWRMDETYLKVKGADVYLYRAVDRNGDTVDFLVSRKRDKAATLAFFKKAINSSGLPRKVTIDKSGSNRAVLERLNLLFFSSSLWCLFIEIRRIKYLNNLVE